MEVFKFFDYIPEMKIVLKILSCNLKKIDEMDYLYQSQDKIKQRI